MKESEFRAAMLLEVLGEPIRFQIVRHLQAGPKAVVELARLTKRHQATICQHLAALRAQHVVRYRNNGKFTFYELKTEQIPKLLDLADRCARQASEMISREQ